jgi:hypothetical protein
MQGGVDDYLTGKGLIRSRRRVCDDEHFVRVENSGD